ncbi:MAG: DNA topoisomerase IV subunit A [Planctomycetota bacterium]|nr:MAG: DNA topoisomerase IV subunit A [Planctomycetota bacterium]
MMPGQRTAPVGKKIVGTAGDIHSKILKGKSPAMVTPIRSLSNVKYQAKTGYFEMLGKNKQRTLTVSTVKTFAQALKMMSLAKQLIDSKDVATKREAYYISKNWGKAGFSEQSESDTIMDDVEAMFGVNREQLRFTPEEKGGDVAGSLIVIDTDAKGKKIKIDCTKFGSGAYSIPTEVENLRFQSQAKFVLAVETAGMFQRLLKYDYWKKARCILISMGGVPTRACRRFIRRLTDQLTIPVYAFVDGDPYGYFNIYRTLKVGSGNAAHMNKFFCVPSVRFLGVTPEDIVTYKLPTHPLKEVDIKRAKDAMKNDPFVKHHKPWQKAIGQMLKMGVRVEQQAFAKHGLNFVVNKYLPSKLKNPSKFLP